MDTRQIERTKPFTTTPDGHDGQPAGDERQRPPEDRGIGGEREQKELPIEGESAIKVSVVPAIKKELPVPDRQKKEVPELPILQGRPGRVHDDEEVNDILDTLLRDGKAPYGRVRQQYNYKFHARLAERMEYLERTGVPIHANFRTRKFWKEWSSKTSQPISTAFYRKFA